MHNHEQGKGARHLSLFVCYYGRERRIQKRMWNQLVLYVCIALEVLLLVRAARTNLFKRFPLFYTYIAYVLVRDVLGTPVYMHYPSLYSSFYWSTEFLVAAISYGVLIEIYSRSLKNYPGAARFFRILLLFIFLLIAAKVGVGLFSGGELSLIHAIADLEGNLRLVQAVLLAGLLALFVYYKIPVGKNLRGLVLGYSLFVAADVITLTFVAHPATGFAPLMRKIEPLLYIVSLLLWSLTLWVSRPEIVSDVSCEIGEDYERFARETKMMLDRARAHLARATRL